MLRKLALWALAGLILADLVPALILDADSRIIALSNEVDRLYANWHPQASKDWTIIGCANGWKFFNGRCVKGDWRVMP